MILGAQWESCFKRRCLPKATTNPKYKVQPKKLEGCRNYMAFREGYGKMDIQ